jgi:hypothetical protein
MVKALKTLYLALIILFSSSCMTSKKLECYCCDKSVHECDNSLEMEVEKQKQASEMMQYWRVKK